MAELHDHLATFADENGVSTLPEGFGEGFEAAYTAERSVAEAAVNVATQERDALAQELESLQALLFRMTTAQAPTAPVESADGTTDDDDDEDKDIEDLGRNPFEDED